MLVTSGTMTLMTAHRRELMVRITATRIMTALHVNCQVIVNGRAAAVSLQTIKLPLTGGLSQVKNAEQRTIISLIVEPKLRLFLALIGPS